MGPWTHEPIWAHMGPYIPICPGLTPLYIPICPGLSPHSYPHYLGLYNENIGQIPNSPHNVDRSEGITLDIWEYIGNLTLDIWEYIGPYGPYGPYGPIWAHGSMGPWVHGPMGPWAHGPIWIHMDPYGSMGPAPPPHPAPKEP